MSDKQWQPSEPQFQLLFAELGRCVHIYQCIELQLKLLLPHLVVSGTESHAPGEGFDNWRALLDSKKTLGMLVPLLAQRTSSNGELSLERAMSRLVEERNEVVHKFASYPFGGLSSEEEYKQAMTFLESRRKSAAPIYEIFAELTRVFITALGGTRNAA